MTLNLKPKPRKTLIAGATGQIGSSVGMHLMGLGDWGPLGLARTPDPHAPYPMLAVDLTEANDCQQKLTQLQGITPEVVTDLVEACRDDPVGGLLALPLPDTLKSHTLDGGTARVSSTVPREDKWLAQTPQMFRLGALHAALADAAATGFAGITDESSAMERLGLSPRLVPGSAQNLKVTYPTDFAFAEAVLKGRT